MKFTPETLLQIYLDGSFTEEAQAEFDALMNKDPVFAERVTQALAERLGPVPDSTVEGLASRLDGKIGDLWNRHRPSPYGSLLRLGFQIAVALAVAGGLLIGGRLLLSKMSSGTPSGLRPSVTLNTPGTSPIAGEEQKTKPDTTGGKAAAGVSGPRTSVPVTGQVPVNPGTEETVSRKSEPLPAQSVSFNGTQDAGIPSQSPAGNQEFIGSTTAPAVLIPPASSSALAPKGSSSGTTIEGNSLRVVIDTDKAQNVTATVLDTNGMLVRHLFKGALGAGEHTVDWDGKDDLGNMVSPGDYTVILDMGGKKMSGILKVLPGR